MVHFNNLSSSSWHWYFQAVTQPISSELKINGYSTNKSWLLEQTTRSCKWNQRTDYLLPVVFWRYLSCPINPSPPYNFSSVFIITCGSFHEIHHCILKWIYCDRRTCCLLDILQLLPRLCCIFHMNLMDENWIWKEGALSSKKWPAMQH